MVKKLKKIFKDKFFNNPFDLYRKEKHLLNQSFYFEGSNKKAILLLHGWSATAYELRRLGFFLNKNGYTVYAPNLKGHGTTPSDLEDVKGEDWIKEAEGFLKEINSKYENVYIGGTSFGSNLAMILASKNPTVKGIVLMATPYRVRMERLIELVIRVTLPFKKYKKKMYPPTFGAKNTITRLISYQTYPKKNVLEAQKVIAHSREVLNKIKQPCLILQSTSDHIVARKSSEKIYSQIGSKNKKVKYIKRAYHTFISDIKKEYIFKDILSFLNEN